MKYELQKRSQYGRPQKLKRKEVIEAINDSGGIPEVIAKKLKVSRQTVMNYLALYPDIAEMVMAERDRVVDIAEAKLFERVSTGEMDAIKFTLTTIGKRRGYSTQTDVHHQGKVEKTLKIKVIGDSDE